MMICFYQDASAQDGLEGIVIEPYYIADANDAGTPGFPVPAGATTFRVYVDMAPGWGLQAIFAATNFSTGEVDTLVIRSSQPFFNNEDFGQVYGYLISTNSLDENTVSLDSWFSTGRSSNNTLGVLKPEDTNAGVPAFPNLDGLLQNNDPAAGIPISQADGNITGTSPSTWTLVGMTLGDLALFDDINLLGNELVISDGAMTSISTPAVGPNASNKVLIGQFTTAGTFSGQVNVQIKNLSTGQVQQWVANTPETGQFTSPSLTWQYNHPPVVSISTPMEGTEFPLGQNIVVSALATDSDGTIDMVEFFFNGLPVGFDDAFPYSVSFTSTTSGAITAVATDNDSAQSTSSAVNITVHPYSLGSIHQVCNLDDVCIPLKVGGPGIVDVIGFDIVMTFDNTKIIPTGMILESDDLLNPVYYNTDYTIDLLNQQMLISVFLTTTAPSGSTFSGIGDLICVQFEKRPAFHAIDSTVIWVTNLQESFAGGGIVQRDSIPPGIFSTYRNTSFLGSLAFWADNSPMVYDTMQPDEYLISQITGTDSNCDTSSAITLLPDLNGAFVHDLNQGEYLAIDRDIAGTTDVQSVINSFDAFLVRKVLIEDPSFIPSVFQVIAMDVNMDGVVSAGDLSQINQRTVLIQDEYKQVWNYDGDGTPSTDYFRSKDWLFVSRTMIDFDPGFTRSSTYPLDDGIGYSKGRVPAVPFCIWTGIDNLPDACPDASIETYFGILLGDANGNYKSIPHDGVLK
jgi:hypothetical protein